MNSKNLVSYTTLSFDYDDFGFEFSNNSKFLAIQKNLQQIDLYDGHSFKYLNLFINLKTDINCFEFTSDSQKIALGIYRGTKIVQIHNQEVIAFINDKDNLDIESISFSFDGQFMATGGKKFFRFYDITNINKPVQVFEKPGYTFQITISRDNQFLAVVLNKNCIIYEIKTFKKIKSLKLKETFCDDYLGFSADSKIFTLGEKNKISYWNTDDFDDKICLESAPINDEIYYSQKQNPVKNDEIFVLKIRKSDSENQQFQFTTQFKNLNLNQTNNSECDSQVIGLCSNQRFSPNGQFWAYKLEQKIYVYYLINDEDTYKQASNTNKCFQQNPILDHNQNQTIIIDLEHDLQNLYKEIEIKIEVNLQFQQSCKNQMTDLIKIQKIQQFSILENEKLKRESEQSKIEIEQLRCKIEEKQKISMTQEIYFILKENNNSFMDLINAQQERLQKKVKLNTDLMENIELVSIIEAKYELNDLIKVIFKIRKNAQNMMNNQQSLKI